MKFQAGDDYFYGHLFIRSIQARSDRMSLILNDGVCMLLIIKQPNLSTAIVIWHYDSTVCREVQAWRYIFFYVRGLAVACPSSCSSVTLVHRDFTNWMRDPFKDAQGEGYQVSPNRLLHWVPAVSKGRVWQKHIQNSYLPGTTNTYTCDHRRNWASSVKRHEKRTKTRCA